MVATRQLNSIQSKYKITEVQLQHDSRPPQNYYKLNISRKVSSANTSIRTDGVPNSHKSPLLDFPSAPTIKWPRGQFIEVLVSEVKLAARSYPSVVNRDYVGLY